MRPHTVSLPVPGSEGTSVSLRSAAADRWYLRAFFRMPAGRDGKRLSFPIAVFRELAHGPSPVVQEMFRLQAHARLQRSKTNRNKKIYLNGHLRQRVDAGVRNVAQKGATRNRCYPCGCYCFFCCDDTPADRRIPSIGVLALHARRFSLEIPLAA